MIKSLLKNIIPYSLQRKYLFSKLHRWEVAKKSANRSKRLDICSAQIAHILHCAGNISIKNKVVLELGSGWVLSHAIIFYLLGAKKVLATDKYKIAYPNSLNIAIKKSILSIPRDILAPFENYVKIRERIEYLLSFKKFDFDTLKDINIYYISPIDLARERMNINIDFIYSNSVLEHIPIIDIYGLLNNITTNLNHNGKMVNCIHLEDHKNLKKPFDFYKIPAIKYNILDQNYRGNRIRKSGWEYIFQNIKNTKSKFLYYRKRKDYYLPSYIDSSINYANKQDLLTSHIAIYTEKK